MENTTEEQIITKCKNNEDEEEKRLKAEDSRKQLKAILITFSIILTGFLIFTYFFFNYIEEKAEEYKQQNNKALKIINKIKYYIILFPLVMVLLPSFNFIIGRSMGYYCIGQKTHSVSSSCLTHYCKTFKLLQHIKNKFLYVFSYFLPLARNDIEVRTQCTNVK
ncbi:hypothetical protein RCA_04170 [Rickettsia canadensis str. CA410]|uniref:Transmembrane protein n=1 Tax=Rickettsia canadensis str. CA410 TaxID=1105107 RepID=A0ABN4ABE9_RICCA|nr:hypothetical protein RCA_04170 [Rickettsia canadensis str. CA410]